MRVAHDLVNLGLALTGTAHEMAQKFDVSLGSFDGRPGNIFYKKAGIFGIFDKVEEYFTVCQGVMYDPFLTYFVPSGLELAFGKIENRTLLIMVAPFVGTWPSRTIKFLNVQRNAHNNSRKSGIRL